MTQEQKDLLLKDLCARLPYGVKVRGVFFNYNKDINKCQYEECDREFNRQHLGRYETLKPYLFPLSSMTKEQKEEFIKYACYEERDEDCGRHTETYYYDLVGHEGTMYPNIDAIDWLNKNYFDFRGLIEQGLAIDATGKNIY